MANSRRNTVAATNQTNNNREIERENEDVSEFDEDDDDDDSDEEQFVAQNENPYEVDSHTLDFRGPKLIKGVQNWIFFFQLIGQVNWHDKPLIVSLVYKICLTAFVIWRFSRFGDKLYMYSLSGSSFRNPIFLFISSAACVTFVTQGLLATKMSLLNLCPLYKILCTRGLCFVKVSTLKKIGSDRLAASLIFLIFNSLVLELFAHKDIESFVKEFSLASCIMDTFAHIIIDFVFVTIAPLDVYIRFSFAHWLLGLKNYLVEAFEVSHRRTAMLKGQRGDQLVSNEELANGQQLVNRQLASLRLRQPPMFTTDGRRSSKATLDFMNFDDIQRSLNNMDDHLEALRNVEVSTMVAAVLNAFLLIGSFTLMTYNLLAEQSDYYHGSLLLIYSLNLNVLFFFIYVGDEWISHALRAFVQAIENEYFTQADFLNESSNLTPDSNQALSNELKQTTIAQNNNQIKQTTIANNAFDELQVFATNASVGSHQNLRIRKKDVLFCREFLHQFENHLHTPWSKVTLKGHIHLVRAFFTLMAAQIIFTSKH